MTNIRAATLTDSFSINALSLHLGYAITPLETSRERLKCLLASTNDEVWVFDESNIILGWIHVFKAHRLASSTFNEIGGLVVAPTARNRGIGRLLVEFVAKQSRDKNLELRVRCNSHREDTHKFYLKTGFTNSKTQHVFTMHL
ncbi:MAG: GNAT family N-acetyltransferase [Psychromonas sp.]